MYSDDELIALSALQHILFCPRQCALIHVERKWFENRYTAEGRVMHERVDQRGEKEQGGLRIEYSLHLVCHELGLIGQADVVEFHRIRKNPSLWAPYPVEYKRGKPKKDNSDKVQLCAQAMCLEEMHQTAIPEGALFYGKTRRRQRVMFSPELREETITTAGKLHDLILEGITPKPVYEKKCNSCSFLDFCMPIVCKGKSVKAYLKKMME